MKKICLAICLIVVGFTAKAQNAMNGVSLVNVYGVDYSKVWVRDGEQSKFSQFMNKAETAKEYVATFEDINLLLAQDPGKYDFNKMLRKTVKLDIEPVCNLIRQRDTTHLRERPEHPINVSEQLTRYELKETEGLGMVFIATNLDKRMGRGTYVVVCFDIATRDILFRQEITTSASGFGLRNYWANTVEDVIEDAALRKELRMLMK